MPRFSLDATTLRKQLEPLVNNWHRQTVSTPASKDRAPSQSFGHLDVTDVILGAPIALPPSSNSGPITFDLHAKLSFEHTLNLEGTKYIPRPYQIEGANFLHARKRAFLTDKPGLGKTLVSAMAADPPVIIFAPTYLTFHWFNFLREVLPHDDVVLATGPKTTKEAAIARHAKWTICNVEMLREYTFDAEFYSTLIIDEAHHLRGHDSQQSKGAVILANKIPRVYLLTATPIFNKPDDLYGQLRLVDRERFHSYWKFCQDYCVSIQMPFGSKVVKGRPNLRPTFESYNLGRTYQDVAMQLPDLAEDILKIDPPPEFKKLYKTLKEQYFIPGQDIYDNALEVLQALRRLTAPQKLKVAVSLLADTEALSGSVIFCYYKDTAYKLGELLDVPVITGDMSPKERLRVAKDNQCIIATISSMSEGVDLSHLHTVIFFELDYVPGVIYQALSRVRRHGNTNLVKVYYIMVENTVDEILYNTDKTRASNINAIIRQCLE